MNNAAGEALTTPKLWDDSWRGTRLPVMVDPSQPGQFMARAILDPVIQLVDVSPDGRILELGGAPGGFVAFLARHYGAGATIVDFSSEGVRMARRNMELLGIDAEIHEADFRDYFPTQLFDLVCSFGLIEHFADVEAVLLEHFRLTRPGGHIVVGVPNFRGINGRILRHTCPSLFGWHNVDAMNPETLAALVQAHEMDLCCARPVGGFDPGILARHEGNNPLYRAFAFGCRSLAWLTRRPLSAWRKINSTKWSGYVVLIARKPAV
jgi:SAM-dependent methyltransferase